MHPSTRPNRPTQPPEAHYQQNNVHDPCNATKNTLHFPEESGHTPAMQLPEAHQIPSPRDEKPYDPKYSPRFINKLFLWTVLRGASNPFVVQEIKPMFRSENVNNEALLAAVIKASGSDKEWSMPRSVQRPTKVVRVHETNSRQEEAKSK